MGGTHMAQDVREYFKNCPSGGQRLAVQTATQLARGGVSDMDVLCRLLAHEPEKLLQIRNIGPKSLNVIRSVCAAYRGERADAL